MFFNLQPQTIAWTLLFVASSAIAQIPFGPLIIDPNKPLEPPKIEIDPLKNNPFTTAERSARALQAALGPVTNEIVKAGGNYFRTYQKAGEDSLATIHKASNDAFATYTKALGDGAREHQKAFDDGIEAGRATARFIERELKELGNNSKKVERRVREGKYADAMWHWSTDNARSSEKNFFKATQESKLINQAASSAAALYGGPGGAAAYAAWSTYRSTGDPNLAFRAGFLAGATAQAGAYTEKMPTGTMGEVVKKAAMAGAAGGIAVAAAGGDEEAIKKGFLQAGGAVLIQSSKDAVNGYAPAAQDALHAYDCVAAKDVDCFSKTTYARKGAKILTDKYGKPLTESRAGQVAGEAWKSYNEVSDEGKKRLSEIARISKLPGKEAIPVMGNKWVLTYAYQEGQNVNTSRPNVVLTQVAKKPPFTYRVKYSNSEKTAQATPTQTPTKPKLKAQRKPAAAKGKSFVKSTAVYVCPVKGFNRTVVVTPYGEGCEARYRREKEKEQIVWRSDKYRATCIAKAAEFVSGLRRDGLACRRTQ